MAIRYPYIADNNRFTLSFRGPHRPSHPRFHRRAGREAIRKGTAPSAGETTVWRALKRLVESGRLEVSGKGRATRYTVAGSAVVRAHLASPYNQRPPVFYRKEFLDAYVPGKT